MFKEPKNHVITAGHHLVVNAKYSIHNVENLNSNKGISLQMGLMPEYIVVIPHSWVILSLLFKSDLKCTLLKGLRRLFVDVE